MHKTLLPGCPNAIQDHRTRRNPENRDLEASSWDPSHDEAVLGHPTAVSTTRGETPGREGLAPGCPEARKSRFRGPVLGAPSRSAFRTPAQHTTTRGAGFSEPCPAQRGRRAAFTRAVRRHHRGALDLTLDARALESLGTSEHTKTLKNAISRPRSEILGHPTAFDDAWGGPLLKRGSGPKISGRSVSKSALGGRFCTKCFCQALEMPAGPQNTRKPRKTRFRGLALGTPSR